MAFLNAAPINRNGIINQEAHLAYQKGSVGLPFSLKIQSPDYERVDTGSRETEFVYAQDGSCSLSEFESMVFRVRASLLPDLAHIGMTVLDILAFPALNY